MSDNKTVESRLQSHHHGPHHLSIPQPVDHLKYKIHRRTVQLLLLCCGGEHSQLSGNSNNTTAVKQVKNVFVSARIHITISHGSITVTVSGSMWRDV